MKALFAKKDQRSHAPERYLDCVACPRRVLGHKGITGSIEKKDIFWNLLSSDHRLSIEMIMKELNLTHTVIRDMLIMTRSKEKSMQNGFRQPFRGPKGQQKGKMLL